ncbi:hypothetical protein Bhyg_17469, partial [Pseudolycoriella hygida]
MNHLEPLLLMCVERELSYKLKVDNIIQSLDRSTPKLRQVLTATTNDSITNVGFKSIFNIGGMKDMGVVVELDDSLEVVGLDESVDVIGLDESVDVVGSDESMNVGGLVDSVHVGGVGDNIEFEYMLEVVGSEVESTDYEVLAYGPTDDKSCFANTISKPNDESVDVLVASEESLTKPISKNRTVQPLVLDIIPHKGCDDTNMFVPTSGSQLKKQCCVYCVKRVSKFVRHLETVHKSEADVKRCAVLPP